jgi:hypothetical protein
MHQAREDTILALTVPHEVGVGRRLLLTLGLGFLLGGLGHLRNDVSNQTLA